MLEAIYQLSPYAPLVIFVASALDIFFVTGFILYGAAMMSSVAMMHATGMISIEGIVAAAYSGTLVGNALNFGIGKLFGETDFVTKKLEQPKVETARNFLKSRGLFLYILIGRCITVTRPLYALILGSLKIRFYRFLAYEMVISLVWTLFWLYVLLQGEKLFFYFFE